MAGQRAVTAWASGARRAMQARLATSGADCAARRSLSRRWAAAWSAMAGLLCVGTGRAT